MNNDEIKQMLEEYKNTPANDKQEKAYRQWLSSSEKPNEIDSGLICNILKEYPTEELVSMWIKCDSKLQKMRLLKHHIGIVLESRIGTII